MNMQATEQHSAEHHLGLAAELRQHLPPGLMHEAGDAHSQAARLDAQAPGHGRVEAVLAVDHLDAVALHIAQAEDLGGFVDIAEQLAEQRFIGARIGIQAGTRHVIAVRHAVQPQRMALQGRTDFGHQQLDGSMVEQDMVQEQGRLQTLAFAVRQQVHQRRAGEVQAVQVGRLAQDQRRLAVHHLNRLGQAFLPSAGWCAGCHGER